MSPGSGASVVRLLDAAPGADEAAPPQASTAELLCLGGDERLHLDPAGRANRYGCAPRPDAGLIAFGSSTASTVSPAAFAAADDLRMRILEDVVAGASPEALYDDEVQRIRGELLSLYGLQGAAEIILAPSGTDLHLIAGQLIAADASIAPLAIIPEEAETGSGVPGALAGQGLQPVEVRAVAARAPDGRPRDPAAADAEVEALAEAAVAEGRQVLVVLIDVSKTGLISPSPACALDLAARHPGQVTVLVDACQLRLSAASLAAYLDRGALVAVTGSKFLTGPAFSAALLVPPAAAARLKSRPAPPGLGSASARADWPEGWTARERLPPMANFGLVLRWQAALTELASFAAVSQAQAAALAAVLERAVDEALARHGELQPLEVRPLDRGLGANPGWDAQKTIFPFLLRSGLSGRWLVPAETARVWRLMREDLATEADGMSLQAHAAARLRIELGQPVAAGSQRGAPVAALRLCLSSRLICEAAGSDPRAASRLLSDARLALAKAAWLAREVAAGRL